MTSDISPKTPEEIAAAKEILRDAFHYAAAHYDECRANPRYPDLEAAVVRIQKEEGMTGAQIEAGEQAAKEEFLDEAREVMARTPRGEKIMESGVACWREFGADGLPDCIGKGVAASREKPEMQKAWRVLGKPGP